MGTGINQNDVGIRILCRRLVLQKKESGLQWLIASPFFPSPCIASTIRCIHYLPSDPLSPHITNESEELRSLLPGGFEVIGALILNGKNDLKIEKVAGSAVSTIRSLRKTLYGNCRQTEVSIGAVLDLNHGSGERDIQFFISRKESIVEKVNDIVYEDQPEKYIWQRACLVRCELPLNLPLYYAFAKDVEGAYEKSIQDVECKLRDPQVTYILESQNKPLTAGNQPVILHGTDLDQPELPDNAISFEYAEESKEKLLRCSYFSSQAKDTATFNSVEEDVDKISVSIMFNRSRSPLDPAAPVAEYYPVNGEAKFLAVNHKLEVLCYATRELLLTDILSNLIIPGLVQQLHSLKNKILPYLLKQQPVLRPYHFMPSGFLHPITVVYELSYRETEMKQGTEFKLDREKWL